MRCASLWHPVVAACVWLTTGSAPLEADLFTVTTPVGPMTIEARLAGTGQDVHVLEKADGQLMLIPQAYVTGRKIQDGPTPLDVPKMVSLLEKEFGKSRIRTMESAPYIAAVVLAGPITEEAESKVRIHLQAAAGYLSRIDKIFAGYAQRMGLTLEPPRFPMVMLIFESDDDFEEYAAATTGGTALSAGNVLGFYSVMTNWLAVRMNECFTFEVPLHEAIHQQVYNRGLFKRMAPIPVWFNEGIATGFENDGEKVTGNPSKINVRYAQLSQTAKSLSWSNVVENNSVFHGDVLAGPAYCHAWCIHWLLATQYPEPYRKYVESVGRLEPMQRLTAEQQRRDFEAAFGKSANQLQAEFPQHFQKALKDQRVKLPGIPRVGQLVIQSGPVEAKVNGTVLVDRGGGVSLRGTVRNRSTFRAWMVYVLVVTDGGTYADWLLPSVRGGQTTTLQFQKAEKRIPGAAVGPARTFSVQVITALPGSEKARKLEAGEIPFTSK